MRDGNRGDGRFIDPNVGSLEGEGAQQRVKQTPPHPDRSPAVWDRRPSEAMEEEPTYYGLSPVREPVWIWSVPAYFYVGGLAGAAATLGAVVHALNGERMRDLVVRCRWLAALNSLLGTVFLIYDLGRPERFINMLRVFRITSPMNVGSWILSAAGGFMFGSALLARSEGLLRRLGNVAGYGAAVAGIPLAGYAAVLVSNTAVPLWQASRKKLPFVFIGSAISSAGAVLKLMTFSRSEEKIIDTFYLTGQTAELAATYLMEREMKKKEDVGKPLHEGMSGALMMAARILGIVSLTLSLLPGRARQKRILIGVLASLSSLCLRFGIFYAGKVSARDPHATFRQQRRGHGAAEVTGQAAVSGPQDKRAVS